MPAGMETKCCGTSVGFSASEAPSASEAAALWRYRSFFIIIIIIIIKRNAGMKTHFAVTLLLLCVHPVVKKIRHRCISNPISMMKM